MGCASSSEPREDSFEGGDQTKTFKAPRSWKHDKPIGPTKLAQMRDEFWDTAPHYGGLKEIWEALKAAAESVIAGDINMAHIIVESAGITVVRDDMTACYDERGNKYDLPKFVLSKPSNMVRDDQVPPDSPRGPPLPQGTQVQLTVPSPPGQHMSFVKEIGNTMLELCDFRGQVPPGEHDPARTALMREALLAGRVPPAACATCGAEPQAPKGGCGPCGAAFYCSKACQRRHWRKGRHRDECPQWRWEELWARKARGEAGDEAE